MLEVKKTKGKVSDILESSQTQGKLRGKESYPSDASPVHIFAALDLLSHPATFGLLSSDVNEKDASRRSVIYYAAANNAQATIDCILDHFGDVLLLDTTDRDLLHLAVPKTDLRLLKKILEDPNLEIPQSLLIAAIDGRHWPAFELLKRNLEKSRPGGQLRQYWATLSDQYGGALHHAVLTRNLALVEYFLGEEANPNNGTGGKMPLHLAAQIGNESITDALIVAGSFVDPRDKGQGNTPLHYATEAGSLKVVKLLTDYGANTAALNRKGQTALHVAARCGHEEIVLLLLASGAEVNGKDKDGTTPLHLACAGSWESVVRRLLDQGGDTHATADENRTPLHLAAVNSLREVTSMLLEAGADLDARDLARQTPLHAAVQRGSVDIVLMLIERGANPSAVDKSGKSPLHCAAASDSAPAYIVQLLIKRGADVELRDYVQHKTALDFAQAEGNTIIAALLKAPRSTPVRTPVVEDYKPWMTESLNREPYSLGIRRDYGAHTSPYYVDE